MKRLLIPIALFAILTAACTSGQSQGSEVSSETSITEQSSAVESSEDAACIDEVYCNIDLTDDVSVYYIDEGGTYVVSGVADDGRIEVDVPGEEVELIFQNVSIKNNSRSPVYIAAADSATGQMFRVIPRPADMESDCRSPKP